MANRKRNRAAREGKAVEGKAAEMVSSYEKLREDRIKANLEKIQKLGILDLSLKFQYFSSSASSPNTPNQSSRSRRRNEALSASPTPNPNFSINQLPPSRRSSRLQNVESVSYVETKNDNDDDLGTSRKRLPRILICEGRMEEIYTEEHTALLGNCETSWTLFVDGYDNDGKRIYDQFEGKTCHQCRQKTLGHHTNCCKCNLVQGQFCGDCLYMRYGENVLEVEKNPTWICPPCRGICNCSICRKRKGWAPTGNLYRKITKLGYKSVAHFLIQTRCKTNIENPTDANQAIDNVEEENTSDNSKHDLNIEDTSDEGSEGSESKLMLEDAKEKILGTRKAKNNSDEGSKRSESKLLLEDGKEKPSKSKENRLGDSIGSRLRQQKKASTVA